MAEPPPKPWYERFGLELALGVFALVGLVCVFLFWMGGKPDNSPEEDQSSDLDPIQRMQKGVSVVSGRMKSALNRALRVKAAVAIMVRNSDNVEAVVNDGVEQQRTLAAGTDRRLDNLDRALEHVQAEIAQLPGSSSDMQTIVYQSRDALRSGVKTLQTEPIPGPSATGTGNPTYSDASYPYQVRYPTRSISYDRPKKSRVQDIWSSCRNIGLAVKDTVLDD
ncbi:hypothetical protein BDV12DRAFT_192816 [Aspergillus spectabilis]